MLDCRSLEFDLLPLGDPPGDRGLRLEDLPATGRRDVQPPEGGVRAGRRPLPGAGPPGRSASSATCRLDDLQAEWSALDPVGRLRARHVLTENDRVVRGAEALRSGDLVGFGALMSASHASSRDDFENSSPALDALFEAAEESPGFLGGKLSGAGWAGCTVNLVRSDEAEDFAESVRTGYDRRTGLVPDVHICHAADGASCRPVD